MFSNENIREAYRSIPPEKVSQDPAGLPPLFLSASGQGFVTAKHVYDGFERCVSTESDRISVTSLGRDLGVGSEVVLQLVEAFPTLAVFSIDRKYIIGKNQRDVLEKRLQHLIETQVVSKTSFSTDNDISLHSLESLLLPNQMAEKSKSKIASDDYIVSGTYRRVIKEIVISRLENSLQESISTELSESTLPGQPPMWLVSEIVQRALQTNELENQFYVQEQKDSIQCTPKMSVVRERDQKIEQLRLGHLPCLELQSLVEQFSQIFTSVKDAETYISTLSGVSLLGTTAISEDWITKFGNECASALDILGYADLNSKIEVTFPKSCQDEIRIRLQNRIESVYKERSGSEPHVAGNFLLTAGRYASERDVLLASAKAHAAHRWEQLKDTPDKDLKFQMPEIIAFIPGTQPVLQAVSADKNIEKAAEDQFWGEISALEAQNELDFATFWKERVASRTVNYERGLEAVQEAKLKQQLSELLANFLAKELLTDAISKARSQGLILSRKTKKNIQKLESTLKAGKDIAGLFVSLEKFNKKQGIEGVDDGSIAIAKTTLVGDLTRKMKKQTDGPVLFLTLVVILFARHNPGLIYATGKFAPKLLKQLKLSLDAEQYQQLEKWKDSAKAGSLTPEDKELMRNFAGDMP